MNPYGMGVMHSLQLTITEAKSLFRGSYPTTGYYKLGDNALANHYSFINFVPGYLKFL